MFEPWDINTHLDFPDIFLFTLRYFTLSVDNTDYEHMQASRVNGHLQSEVWRPQENVEMAVTNYSNAQESRRFGITSRYIEEKMLPK
jgi:hypothetical protein